MVTLVERGQHLKLTLDGMGRLGEAMALVDGKPVFVFGGIPGEEVVVEVIRERRHYIAAQVMEVIKASPHRVQAPCAYFGPCTGCQWQHIDYSHQLELKRHAVESAMQRVGGLTDVPVLPIMPSPQQYGYRNHARFTIGPQGRLGYVHRERRRFVDIDMCMLMDPWINQTLEQLQGHCAETTQLSVRYGPRSGGWLIQPALENPEVALASGQKHYQEAIGGFQFRVAASSFFQVNIPQAEAVAKLLRESLGLSGRETLVDAYAGVGTFAALLSQHCARVIAIEESASAIKDAGQNLARFPNVEVRQGKTEAVLGDLEGQADVVVLDPPRAGCQGQALESLMTLAPTSIAYVSCDPETLARDLKVLVGGPYRIEFVQPVDMFPQTHHVECVAILRLKPGYPITLASASPRRRQILDEAGIPFRVAAPMADETRSHGTPEAHVQALALAKARSIATSLHRGLVLAADTVVVDGETVLGKPRDDAHALEMLERLQGRQHRVITGVAVVDPITGESVAGVETSLVTMRLYTDADAQAFVASGRAIDKAGAYAIQDPVFQPAATVDGCYLNVVGLPLCLTIRLLQQLGAAVDTPPPPGGCLRCPLKGGLE